MMIFGKLPLKNGKKVIRYGKSSPKLNFEKVTTPEDASIALETVAGSGFHCIYHYHPEWELTYVASGAGRLLIGSELTAFAPGQLALIGANVPHFYAPSPAPGAEAPSLPDLRVIKISHALQASDLLRLPEFQPAARLLAEQPNGMLFSGHPRFAALVPAVFDAEGAERLLGFLRLLLLLAETPGRPLAPEHPPEAVEDSARIERALQFIRRRFREKLSLASAGAAVGMDKESFRRFFRRTVRLGFADYVTELRLAHAQRLLARSDRSISEIALDSGFPNLSNFNRQFLRRRGRTPRDYRKHINTLLHEQQEVDYA